MDEWKKYAYLIRKFLNYSRIYVLIFRLCVFLVMISLHLPIYFNVDDE